MHKSCDKWHKAASKAIPSEHTTDQTANEELPNMHKLLSQQIFGACVAHIKSGLPDGVELLLTPRRGNLSYSDSKQQ